MVRAASHVTGHQSCETELPRARLALQTCRFAIAKEEAGATLRRRAGQCAKSKSCQLCTITHGPTGKGQGRCATSCRTALIPVYKTFSTSPFSEYTLLPGPRIESCEFKTTQKAK